MQTAAIPMTQWWLFLIHIQGHQVIILVADIQTAREVVIHLVMILLALVVIDIGIDLVAIYRKSKETHGLVI